MALSKPRLDYLTSKAKSLVDLNSVMESYEKGISPPLSAFFSFRFLQVQSALPSPDNKLCWSFFLPLFSMRTAGHKAKLVFARESPSNPRQAIRSRNIFGVAYDHTNRNQNISGASSTLSISGRKSVNGRDNKRLKVGINGMHREVVVKAWQDTEEEEFDWREIIPSSQHHSQRNGLVSSSSTPLVAEEEEFDWREIIPSSQYHSRRSGLVSSSSTPIVADSGLVSSSSTPLVADSVPNKLVPAAAAAVPAVVSSPSLIPPYTCGTITANNYATIDALPSPIRQVHPSMSTRNAPSRSSSMHLPPTPPRPSPAFSHSMPMPNIPVPISFNSQVGGALSTFTSSLNGERLFSFTNQDPVQDPVPLDFNPNFLKVHHESVLNALYADLSRQCGTCGFRYKSQEKHDKHIDWHARKTQICNGSKRSSKQKPYRGWYVSAGVWLDGAGALGTVSVANTKGGQEIAVPADDNQTACALCGERFDDFFSEETDDWMYKGAVYMNGPGGDSSRLGPIVHAKCM